MAWTPRQKDAIEKRNTDLLVSAAAGSGKTAVLIERIRGLLLNDGIGLDRMLIVTFTNAATAEMKERIYEMLRSAASDPDIDPERRSFLRHQINLMGNAYICTFDKFAIQLVRRYYHIIGVRPDLSICQGPSQTLLINDSVQELFSSLFESDDRDFLWFLDRYADSKSNDPVRNMILSLYTFLQSLPDPDGFLDGLETGSLFDEEKYITYAAELCRDRLCSGINLLGAAEKRLLDAGLVHTALCVTEDLRVLKDIESMFTEARNDDAFSALSAFSFSRMSSPKEEKEAWNLLKEEFGHIRDAAKTQVKKAAELSAEILGAALSLEREKTAEPLRILCRLTREFGNVYGEKKRAKALADFSDMQHFCLRILEDPEVCREYREALDQIFIDEYQDSNLIQEEIIRRISRPDNVFMVGDVKQSIYKFRLAEPELFIGKYDDIRAGRLPNAEVVDLNSNFRSKRPVIEYVNRLFSVLMSRQSCGIDYDEDAALKEGIPYDGEGLYEPRLYLIDRGPSEIPDEDLADLSADELEAKHTAKLIRQYVGKPVFDSKKGVLRSLRYSDIAVLLRAARGHGEVYYDVLSKAGIPVYLDRSEGYFDTLEIQVFLNLLKLIDNRRRDVPLLSVLRFPSFGFHAEDLAQIRIFSGTKERISYSEAFERYCTDGPDGSLKARCCAFAARLTEWRREAMYLPLGDFLWKLLNETGVADFASSVPDGAQREANLRALVDKAESYESSDAGGLYGFIHYIEMINARGGKVEIGQVRVLSESADVVRIMTIHKSKGLEFPMVIVAGLGGGFSVSHETPQAVWHRQFGASIRVVNPETLRYAVPLSYRLIAAKSAAEESAERIRLLYVAMTRAKDILLLSGCAVDAEKAFEKASYAVPGDVNGCANYLQMLLPLAGRGGVDVVRSSELSAAEADIASFKEELSLAVQNGFDLSGNDAFPEVERRLNFDYSSSEQEEGKRKYSVSQLAEAARNPFLPAKRVLTEEGSEEDVSEELMLRGAAKGTAYHTVMEHLPFTVPAMSCEEIAAFIEDLCAKNILTGEEAASVDPRHIRGFLDSDLGRRAAASGALYKEAPFVLKHRHDGRDVLVQGTIDCFFEEDGKYVLVDYKSNHIDRSDLENELKRMRETYLPQLELYREALEKIRGIEVKESFLYLFSADTELKL